MRAGWLLKAAACGALAVFCFVSLATSQLPDHPTRSAGTPSVEEQYFFRAANTERVARGLPAYKWDEALAVTARKHAALMAKTNELSHQLPGEPALDERAAHAGARFASVGENVAIGTDTPGIQNGWMESPGHRANILDAHFTALGVGVIEKEGEFYAVEDFSRAVEDLSREQQEEEIATLLRARGFHVVDDRAEARRACEKNYVPAHRSAMGILRLESPDLSTLSDDVERSLRSQKYRRAEVGACPEVSSEKGIARFRVIVLLFPDSEKPAPK